ncbi:MAG TPA: hypothetical protein PLL71_00665 [Agriterribacter sp.]|nr:hypothetical protein [Agriterribacter sp.]
MAQKKKGIAAIPVLIEASRMFWAGSVVYSSPRILMKRKQRQERKYIFVKAFLKNDSLCTESITIAASRITDMLFANLTENAMLTRRITKMKNTVVLYIFLLARIATISIVLILI